jgi:hemerythrin-like domain-containing protein
VRVPNHDTPTGLLRDQHQQVLKVADILEQVLDAWDEAPVADPDALADCITFIRLFADALHHGKEEELLFPALIAAGLPKEEGPIAVMLQEHALGRGFARAMASELSAARGGDAAARRRLVEAGRDYIELIRNHIMKEDEVLFEMADQMIEEPACRRLCAAYDGVCRHRFEGRTVGELEAILARLVERYPGA